ncbi:ribonuclease H-like domain-containing protein [Irpex rosettiformis]|uniref:Ribonuclease H-like domain-containing protein n=1 Tax=Irpex rosettiformis TaxID=378272 RepID=A0ACB8TR44_9APHY|nr:ribonuclease H-like domain-containing protein [Irpex rosettiformis]
MSQPPRGRGGGRGGGRGRGGPRQDFETQSSSSAGSGGGFRGGGGGFRGGPPGGRGGGGPRGGIGGGRGGPPTIFAAGTAAVPSPHLSELDALVNSFRTLQVTPESPLRPGFGTAGRAINLRANFFALRLPKKMLLYDYEVKVAPDVRGPRKARIFELLEGSPECSPYVSFIAHDSSQRIVSTRQLPQPLAINITYTDPGQTQPSPKASVFNVKITFVRPLDFNEIMPHLNGQQKQFDTGPFVSAMNLLLQKQMAAGIAQSTAVRVGQNKYFSLSQPSFPLSLGLEARRGYFMSVRPMYKQLMVNVNACMAAFYSPGNMADAMLAFIRTQGAMPSQFVQRLKIETSHLGYSRRRPIRRIMGTNARQQKFPCEELGGSVTVEQYFQRKYNIRLRYADQLPVIDVGTKEKPNYLPPEICTIFPGQPYRGELPPDATRSMIDVACNPPADNANYIVNEGLAFLGLKTNTAALDKFDVTVSPDMAVVPARILPPPQITYAAGRANVNNASWNILDVKFHKGGNMTNWAVLLVQDGRRGEFSGATDPALKTFLQTFMNKCRTSGLAVASALPTIMVTPLLPRSDRDPGRKQALEMIRRTFVEKLQQDRKPSFVLVLLSGEDKFIYPGMKRMCDMQLGLQTVFMLLMPKKAGVQDSRKLDQYFSNVCLKVNAKLGGVNHLLRDDNTMRWLKAKKTMLVGVDVTHPSPTSLKGTPSIVAVVASVDDEFAQYPASLGLQRNRNINRDSEEMIQELANMITERLLAYEKKMKRLPERVIVFRDGVSEGQYDLVLEKELPRILDAFKKFATKERGGKYRPDVSIIVCGKRHHARFPATAQDHMSKNGNTVPGTVVDKGVTAIYNHDFYLQAHDGLKGTVRPTHYWVVYDEIKIPADTIQGITHNLSYLYARATKGVSLVPPAYYADIACERARLYLNQLMDTGDNRSVTSRTSDEAERQRVYDQALQQWGNGVHQDLKESMFYI